MNAFNKLIELKTWLNKVDEAVLDAFANRAPYLILHLDGILQDFHRTYLLQETPMPMIKPSEITPVQPKVEVMTLDNAKQDEPYFLPQTDELVIKEVSFSQDCGLVWNSEKRAIEGIPSISGDIVVSFRFDDGSVRNANLFINPNPKSLWKNIPSDPQSRFWKADSASDLITTEKGKLIAARQRGRSHALKGTCCDDDFAMAYHQATGMHFLAVADGAGSAEFSREGSRLAVNAAKEKALELLNLTDKSYKDFPSYSAEDGLKVLTDNLFFQTVQAAFLAQEKTARDADIELKSLSCTLLLAFTLPLNNGRWFSACYWVGDGAAAIFDPQLQKVELLGEVDSGQYSGETQFLTRSEANADQLVTRIRTCFSDYPPLLMLMTDGVSDPKFQTDAKLQTADAWQTLWDELKVPLRENAPEKVLEDWLDFFSKGEHDDRTLALFVPDAIWAEIQVKPTEAVQETQAAQEIQAIQETSVPALEQAVELNSDLANSETEQPPCIAQVSEKAELTESIETAVETPPVLEIVVTEPVSLNKVSDVQPDIQGAK